MMQSFFIQGTPVPQGSKNGRVVTNKVTGRQFATVYDQAGKRLKDWRKIIHYTAKQKWTGEPLEGPVRLVVTIYIKRPKNHYGTGKNADRLKPNAPEHHITTPDRTKLLRAIEDGLTGICWKDDSQVVAGECLKLYAPTRDESGCLVEIDTPRMTT